MNIVGNEKYEIVEQKDHLSFIIENGGREFVMSTKNCPYIDFDIIDRIIKGIQIDTHKF